MLIDLSEKTALLTGSTRGIGFAVAKGLAESGAKVVINGRPDKAVDGAIAVLKKAVPTVLVPFYLITHAIVAAQLAAQRPVVALSHACRVCILTNHALHKVVERR
jgi:NAD(P)-dependent dehydrogenase (short-subunit alcohol dehydrogenase family)